MPRVLGVIPARYASTRFPGKPLAPLGDGSLLEQVWRRVIQAARVERWIVATDDDRIIDAARRFGAEAMLTDPAHSSGTDRVAEVLLGQGERYDLVVNVQGDEPLILPLSIDRLVEAFADPLVQMATLSEPILSASELFDPNVVKLVAATDGRALYFSRSPIPYHRGHSVDLTVDFGPSLAGRPRALAGYSKHQGVYAYSRKTLLALARLDPSPLEMDEGLEQLRALQAGFVIRVVESDFRSQGVDTPADLDRVARLLTEAP